MNLRRRKLAASAVILAILMIGLGAVSISSGFCPDCNSCPPEYSEKIGSAGCFECETDQCWIVPLVLRGWRWFINTADHLRIPGTIYQCWHTTICVDDECYPLACEM
jgi:hypothetical protein